MLEFAVCVFVSFTMVAAEEKMISKGSWRVIEVQLCEEEYSMKFNITKYKVTRTEDAFDGECWLEELLDDSYSLHVDISKYTDGGWRDYSVIKDDCFVCFLKKYAEELIRELFSLILPELKEFWFPFPKGRHYVVRYKFNNCQLPEEGVLGLFKAKALIIDKRGMPAGCVILIVEFREEVDDCDQKEEE